MTPRTLLARLAAMSGTEARFRAICETRRLAGGVRFAMSPPRWQRRNIVDVLDADAGPLVREARAAARQGDYLAAHAALGRHFTTRAPRWPIAAVRRDALAGTIRARFPLAAADARNRADVVVDGRYDLLGLRGLPLGTPPDWHADLVHGRRAPRGYWARVPYLDPASGDHKVIWEVNRHQHFLTLGAAAWLTGDGRYRDTVITHLQDWLAHNPPLDGVNWASMLELAFRTLSWTWALELFAAGAERDRTPWLVDLLVALDRQLTHVEHNLSTYFSPNTHISGEALALYAVSRALPELRRSRERAHTGRTILLREASAQVNDDGGHAELSSHYHRYSTDFYLLALLVARLTNDAAAAPFERTLRAQARYLRTIADARGRLPNIGDDDAGQLFRFGDAPGSAASTLTAVASALDDPALAVADAGVDVLWILGDAPAPVPTSVESWPSQPLDASGYWVSRDDRAGHHLIFDAGRHGFLNGGHAHADALSVVVTVAGEPLLVDPGTGTYTMDAGLRDRLRSSHMHNTVTVDGRPFATPRGPFHWSAVATARLLTAEVRRDAELAIGTHDAYGFAHVRAVVTVPGRGWLIVDRLSPPRAVRADAWWHLHPSWTATQAPNGFALRHGSGHRLALATTATDCGTEMQPYSPEYGRIEEAPVLRTTVVADGPCVIAAFVPVSVSSSAVPRLALVACDDDARSGWTTYTWSVAGDVDLSISLALPHELPARPSHDWPQPCIQETRAVCVE